LIKSQAIDDEFLEWFVKNPSCEEVKFKEIKDTDGKVVSYRFISALIPKEEPKQETLEELPTELESVLAKIIHLNELGLSQWYEVVYYVDGKWCSYSGSNTFQDGERVIDWKYCKDLI
jgi:hypothetical protein